MLIIPMMMTILSTIFCWLMMVTSTCCCVDPSYGNDARNFGDALPTFPPPADDLDHDHYEEEEDDPDQEQEDE